MDVTVTYIGGPTALIEIGGLRLLTDPTFDPEGTDYRFAQYTLRKLSAPALDADALGRVDAVLLSHDHHADNLDQRGRSFLGQVPRVLTTGAGAARLRANAIGLSPWQSTTLQTPGGDTLEVVATPARHGPADGDRGPVVGFALRMAASQAVYLSGDTVWYDGIAEIARRLPVGLAVLFMGAARVRQVTPAHLTFTAAEAVEAARAFGDAPIVPLHYEGWAHFSESRPDIDATFRAAGLSHRLAWLAPGVAQAFDVGRPPAETARTRRAPAHACSAGTTRPPA